MWRMALERGLSAIVAKQLREARLDALFAQVGKMGAMKPEQITKLRAELEANLRKAEAEGGPYADVLTVALRELTGRLPDVREALNGVGRAAAEAASKTADAARAEVRRAAQEVAAKRQPSTNGDDVIDTEVVRTPGSRA